MSAQPHADESVWTIKRLLTWTGEYLERQGVDETRLAAEVLLAHATNCRRIDLYARPEDIPSAVHVEKFRGLVKLAARHEPIAYLVGVKEFLSLSFKVTRDVLIPRPETETLVEAVVDYCRERMFGRPRLVDIGTGSGCIAVAILTQLENATVVATDISQEALDVASQNAAQHGVSDRFEAVLADRLALPTEVVPSGGFDVLMSNPPYVAQEDISELPANVRDCEPTGALTDGADGLSFYRSIAASGPALSASDGAVVVEIGDGQADRAKDALENDGGYRQVRRLADTVTGRERVLVLSRVT
ncbi:MAG: peptide chain release factor N(5)-glutamine methyltransferase [Planctomycetes bacterium]|nr:peptide chain release factor N(5)-glutamine methyltransferase [Planctomycetota bacterium]